MTSGVKQALPQVLMPKTGAEGKAARNRAPQGDFAEALGIGKSSKQPKSAEAKAERQQIEAKPLWQRLAAKLDTADRTQDSKLEAVTPKEPAEKEPAEDKPGTSKADDAGTTTPSGTRQADTVQAPAPPAISAHVPAETTGPQRQATTSRKEAPAPVDPDATVTIADSKASQPATPDAARKQDSAAPIFVPMGRGEPAEPIRFEPVAGSAAAPAEQSSADRTQAKEALPEASAEPAKTAPRITVLAQQSIPAPMPSTAIVLADTIAASDLLEPLRNPPALDAIHASATHASAQSLKIQLHPAELGMVTATLRFAGEQLSIELQVENHEAYRHLSNDSDTIVSSLRDLGYEIDRVTVLQPQLASTPAGRADTGASLPSPQGRVPEQFGAGVGPGGNGGSGGRQSQDGGNPGRGGQQHPASSREQQGNGLYI
jgi:chemotaxis protein MotD